MKVVVTGGRGFLGTHVCTALREAGHEPVPLGRADGDLAEPDTIERQLADHEPDVVVHLAAVMPGDERIAHDLLPPGGEGLADGVVAVGDDLRPRIGHGAMVLLGGPLHSRTA